MSVYRTKSHDRPTPPSPRLNKVNPIAIKDSTLNTLKMSLISESHDSLPCKITHIKTFPTQLIHSRHRRPADRSSAPKSPATHQRRALRRPQHNPAPINPCSARIAYQCDNPTRNRSQGHRRPSKRRHRSIPLRSARSTNPRLRH